MAPLISVIIPCYNARDYLQETIESVLKQTYSNLEILVIDDGSTDDSLEKIAHFKNDITLIKQPNQGVSAARNNGVEHAKGQWFAFLDADDIWFPNKLEVQIENIKSDV